MMGPDTPPAPAPPIPATADAMNSALPGPQPARNPTRPAIEPDSPASAENVTTMARPTSSVRLGPMRLDTQPVTSMHRPVTAKYDVKSSDTWLGVARRPLAMAGR